MKADPDRLGFMDLVDLFGVSATRVEQLIKTDSFPKPMYIGRKTRVWRRKDIHKWAISKGRAMYTEPTEEKDNGQS